MIVLDTNVISELMKDAPDPRVTAWARGARLAELRITSTTVAEVFLGIERLPNGKRKRALSTAAGRWVDEMFRERVLVFGSEEARHYASLAASRMRSGRPIGMPDAQIAAIALAHGATLATRNVKDFEGIGLTLINPWDASQAT